MIDWEVTTGSPEETELLGELLGQLLAAGDVVLLGGDLGSGKTCLTRGLARGLGVPQDEPVTSPSYTLMNHYLGRCEFFHFDLYRLEQFEDLDDLGFDEVLAGDGVVVVEWSQRFSQLATRGLRIDMCWCAELQRRARFCAANESERELLRRLQRAWQTSKERA